MLTEPNAVPVEGRLTSAEPYRSGRVRARAAVALFLLFAATCLLAIVSNALQLGLLARAAEGARLTREQFRVNDLRQFAVAAVSTLVYVAALAAFLAWVHRAYSNLRALGNPEHAVSSSPGWAVGSFFIPFVNLYKPYQALRETWDLSDPGARTHDDLTLARPGGSPLLLCWWVVWLLTNVLGLVVMQLAREARTLDTLLWMTKVFILVRVLNIANALLTTLVVRRVQRRQDERSLNVTHTPDAPPPPPVFATKAGA